MRELTVGELELVSGGVKADDSSSSGIDYEQAFQDLKDWLNGMGGIFSGWFGTYISGFGDAADAGLDAGRTIDEYEDRYNQEINNQGG